MSYDSKSPGWFRADVSTEKGTFSPRHAVCDSCFAVVSPGHWRQHLDWHNLISAGNQKLYEALQTNTPIPGKETPGNAEGVEEGGGEADEHTEPAVSAAVATVHRAWDIAHSFQERYITSLQSENAALRFQLWSTHPCTAKYGDNGEMQCNRNPPIDFKRDGVADICRKIAIHNIAQWEESRLPTAPPPPGRTP